MATPPPPSSVWMVDGQGKDIQVAPDEAAGLLRQGAATFREDQVVPVQTGKGVVEMSARDAIDYFNSAEGRTQGGASSAAAVQEQRLQEELGGVGGQLAAAGYGAARGLTLGLSDAAIAAVGGEQTRERLADYQRIDPGASLVGEGLGMVAPLIATGGGSSTGLLGKAATAVPRLGQAVEGALAAEAVLGRVGAAAAGAAVEGGLYGIGQEISRTSIQDVPLTAERIVAAAGHGAILGGAAGGGLSALGALLRGGASKLGDVGAGLLGQVEATEARLAGELAGSLPKAEGTMQALAGKAEREFALKSTGASAEAIQVLRQGGPELEQRVVRQAMEDLPRAAGKEAGSLLSPAEKAAAATKLEADAAAKVAGLGDEMAQAGAKSDLKKLVQEFRAEKGLVETGMGRDAAGRYLPSSMGPEARKAMKETQEWLSDLEKIGEGDLASLTEAQARIRRGLDTATPPGQSLALDLRRDLATAVDAEVARVRALAEEKLGPEFAARWTNAQAEHKAASWLSEATAKGGAKAPEAFGLEEAGKAALGALTSGSLMGVPVAVAGSYASHLVRRYGADVAANLARAATRGEAIQALDRTVERIAGERVAQLVGAGKRAVEQLPAAAGGVATVVERAVRDEQPATERPGTVSQRYKAAKQELLDALPTRAARAADATQGLDDVAPGLAQAVQARVQAASDFLAGKLPKVAQRASLQPHLERERLPSFDEMERYLRYERAVSDPLSVLEDARKGRLKREGVEALREVYPTIYQGLRSQVAAAVAEKGSKLSYQQELQLGLLFPDLPTHPSLEPRAIAAYQAIQRQVPSPFTPVGGAPAAPRPSPVPLRPPAGMALRSDTPLGA
jgi:hypothetical protein